MNGKGTSLNDLLRNKDIILPNIHNISKVERMSPTRHIQDLVEGTVEQMNRDNAEKILREEKTAENIEKIAKLLELAEQKPEVINKISTLIQNSTINGMQNNYDNSTGVQNVVNNSGLSIEEYKGLLESMREIASLFPDEKAKEVEEVIDDLEEGLSQNPPKKGRIKAAIWYLSQQFNNVVLDPVKSIVKSQLSKYAKEKALEVIGELDKVEKFIIESVK